VRGAVRFVSGIPFGRIQKPSFVGKPRALSFRSERGCDRRGAFELFSPKYFRVFLEDLLYLAQRLENGRDPRSQFWIFIRKVRIITIAVEHCRYPLAAWQMLPSPTGRIIPGRDYWAIKRRRWSLSPSRPSLTEQPDLRGMCCSRQKQTGLHHGKRMYRLGSPAKGVVARVTPTARDAASGGLVEIQSKFMLSNP
jgi:hypothetical protein